MQALVFQAPWRLTVEDVPDPDAADGDVLLEVLATGICGSDLHGYTGESGRRQPGQVMGHESVARVLTDRSGTYPPGCLVTVNPVIGCGVCDACRAGRTQRCGRRVIVGVAPDVVSAFAQRMTVPAGNVVALASEAPEEIGALVEPLAVGYHAARRGAVGPGTAVLVIGGGPIGQAAALAARRLGAAGILVSEPDEFRRGKLAALGIAAVDPTRTPADQILGLLGGSADVVIDAVGTSET
ncbi:MAG: alcohol dehydrogenase catalytic domain-containing protein, partial [Acidimicrobiaceae bacterium]|nr:alcohol dehydrogenase catalytic domain-containing protein [Acidimicrobiaceae bacterium]